MGDNVNKYERAKLWVKRNQDVIVTVGVCVAFVGLSIVIVKSSINYQEQLNAELDYYIDELNALHNAKEL